MHWSSTRERGTTLVEASGLTAGVLVLVLALGPVLAARGGDVGRSLGARIEAVVRGMGTGRGSWHAARERRRGSGGDGDAARVSRNQMRLSPALRSVQRARWDGTWLDARTAAGAARIRGTACMLCIGGEWSHDLGIGTSADAAGASSGVHGEFEAIAHAALATVDLRAAAHTSVAGARASGTARVRGLVGADATARGAIDVGASKQRAGVELGAAAGAVGRVQTRTGLQAFGVALENTAYAEGWAGAGARVTARVDRADGALSWDFGWGAALGLGGGAGWSGSLDTSQLSPRQREIVAMATRTLVTAVPQLAPVAALSFLSTKEH